MKHIVDIQPWTLFRFILSFYLLCMVAGLILGRFGLLDIKRVASWSRRLQFVYSPIMPLRNYYRGVRNRILIKKRIRLLSVMIFLNNFILALLYSKIALGVIPFLPLLLLFFTGLGQGTVLARHPAAALSPLLFLEFGGYVFGSTMGVALSLSIVYSLIFWDISHFTLFLTSMKLFMPWAIAFLLAGAIIESLFLRMMPIPDGTTPEELQKRMEAARQDITGN